MMRRLRSLFADERGKTAIEFAICAPVLFTIIFGTFDWGRYFWTRQILQGAATSTARCLAIGTCTTATAPATAVAVAEQYGMGLAASAVTAVAGQTAAECSGGTSSLTFYKVTIDYSYAPIVPFDGIPSEALAVKACFATKPS